LAKATEHIQGESSFEQLFEYDEFGNLIKEHFDADADGSIELTLDKDYDKGILKSVKLANTTLWELKTMNSNGQISNYNLGNQLVSRSYDSHDFLSKIDYANDYYIDYDFDSQTGNLQERYISSSNGITENFEYDNLNRLTQISYNNVLQQSIDYSPTGNIKSKTHAGYYEYHTTKRGAINKLSTECSTNDDNPGDKVIYPTIPTDVAPQAQQITYTSAHNPATIIQNNYTYGFAYGPNQSRKIMTRSLDGYGLQYTRYYHGNYEQEINEVDNENIKNFYINGGNGLCALYRIVDGTPTLYHVHTDHLGSIIALKNSATDALDEQYSYDAWGRRRNADTYAYTGFTVSLTNRGYTGHEHLDAVQLINMNGRMYDPILGRMLSPDNNIQAPDFSQSLNRYSYCINNPLMYTDPDGEWFGIDDAIAAGFGFIVGYASYGFTTGNWGWKAVASGGIGAGVAWLGWNTMGAGTAALAHGAGSATSFSAGMTAVFGSASGSYGLQFAALTALNVSSHGGDITTADRKGWDGVWAMGGYMAGSVLSTSLKPFSIGAKQAGLGLRQFAGVSLTNNLSDNMENGFFNFHSVHVGPVGWDANRQKNNHTDGWGGFYTIGSHGLTGDQRFAMGFETVLGLSLVKSDIYLPKRIKPITGGDAYWKTANCYRQAYKFGHAVIKTSQIGVWSRNLLQASDAYFMLTEQQTTYQYWYNKRFNDDGTLNGW